MKEVLESVWILIKEYKGKIKRAIIGATIVAVVGVSAIVGIGYYYVTSNINYDESAAGEIALEKVSGEILFAHKDIDNGILEYEFSIRDENNTLVEVTVDSKYGTIVEYEANKISNLIR